MRLRELSLNVALRSNPASLFTILGNFGGTVLRKLILFNLSSLQISGLSRIVGIFPHLTELVLWSKGFDVRAWHTEGQFVR